MAFNELRSDLVLLSELRQALSTCTFELESLKHQFETACPGKTLSIPPVLAVTHAEEPISHGMDTRSSSSLRHTRH